MKLRLRNDRAALPNEADVQTLDLVLESQQPEAATVEESQVNSLLEILDARPDIQVMLYNILVYMCSIYIVLIFLFISVIFRILYVKQWQWILKMTIQKYYM